MKAIHCISVLIMLFVCLLFSPSNISTSENYQERISPASNLIPINVTLILYEPSVLIENDMVNITAYITNSASVAMTAIVNISIIPDNTLIKSIANYTLPPGSNSTVYGTWKSVAGIHEISITVSIYYANKITPVSFGQQEIDVKNLPISNIGAPFALIGLTILFILIMVMLPGLLEQKIESPPDLDKNPDHKLDGDILPSLSEGASNGGQNGFEKPINRV